MRLRRFRTAFCLAMALSGFNFARASPVDLSHALWNRVLREHVRNGKVGYEKLKADPGPLIQYLNSLARTPASEYAAWGREEKIAFWINAYNALTIKAVIDHYPIRPSWVGSIRYPKNSIRQIPGVWDKLKFRVAGRELTLNEIEHDILRKEFAEPRVHMALVCASVGCPPLRSEALTGSGLNAQLDDQARTFLRTPSKLRIDRAAKVVFLSPIFQWFGGDFTGGYTPATGFPGHNVSEKAALNFIGRYLDDSDRRYLESGDFKVKFLDYDWSLNERSGP